MYSEKQKTSMDGSGNACHMSSNSMKYLPTYLHLCRSVETLDSLPVTGYPEFRSLT